MQAFSRASFDTQSRRCNPANVGGALQEHRSAGVDLRRLVVASEGVRAAAVIGLDGRVRASAGDDILALRSAISFAVGLVDLGQRLSQEMSVGMLQTQILTAESGSFVLHHIDDDSLAVVFVAGTTPVGAVVHDLRLLTVKPDARSVA